MTAAIQVQPVLKGPVPFNAPMVRALLRKHDPKTQTRRILRIQPSRHVVGMEEIRPGVWLPTNDSDLPIGGTHESPYRVGHRLYVRERARLIETDDGNPFVSGVREGARVRVRYEADGAESDWLPYPTRLSYLRVGQCVANGCHREASRITLEVASVRAERVQDISEEDARAEGVGESVLHGRPHFYWPGLDASVCDDPRWAFRHGWRSIYGAESWERDWVWVYEFRRVTP